MNNTISPLEFLLTNVICFAVGAVAVATSQWAIQLAYRAGQRTPARDE